MAFKLKGYTAFTQPDDGDIVSGRSQIDEIKHDIERLKEDIANPEYSTEIVNKFRKALRENQAALIKLQKNK